MPKVRKPRFTRQESWRLKRLHNAWRRPKGVTSRMRKDKGGWPVRVKVGYGTTVTSRGLHPSGLSERRVEKGSELDGLDPKSHIVRFSSRVGERKRLALLARAREFGLRVANPGREEVSTVGEREAVSEAESAAAKEMVEERAEDDSGTVVPSDAEESGR